MKKTLYTAIIEAEDGIHLIRKEISDPTAEYEDFEEAMQTRADDLDGELLTIYAPDDIVEDETIEEEDTMTTIATGYTATNKPVQFDLDSNGTVWITYTATNRRRKFNDECYTDTPETDIRFMLTSAGYRLD